MNRRNIGGRREEKKARDDAPFLSQPLGKRCIFAMIRGDEKI